MTFLVQRLNELNEWYNEQSKHAVYPKARAELDAKYLALREAAERSN
jgi:hypothetical protein